MPNRNEFGIAIICALPIEANAIEAIFDEHYRNHEGPAQGEQNIYSMGRIGKHQVVLVHMPGMNNISSASVAARIRIDFPRISLALVVGICGGMPHTSENDEIFLGDIIVSTALIQHDFGRQYPDRTIRKNAIEDSLGRPNQQIRAFLRMIQADQRSSNLSAATCAYLSDILNQANFENFGYPGQDADVLYESSYQHKHHSSPDCNICVQEGQVCDAARALSCSELGCDHSKRIIRNRVITGGAGLLGDSQPEFETPSIHYGRVASTNYVMKSAVHRDQIAQEEGVLAFEMEGAGVWDNLPTLVIKSVCDYADSHKNKAWQRYASVTAAAYTKALLSEWSPLSTAHIVLSADEKKCMECLYTSDYEFSRVFNSDRVQGTCEWFLRTEMYQQWQEDERTRVLWVSADPGCGKSILASFLIEKLEQLALQKYVPTTICYFFFKDNAQQNNALLALRAMIHQLFTAKPFLIAIAVAELQKKSEKFVEEFGTLWRIFTTAATSSGDNVICVIDGLDECEESTRNLLTGSLATFYAPENQSHQVLKFIITSRPQLSIEYKFHNIPHMRLKFEDQLFSTNSDIELVVRARVMAIGEKRGIAQQAQSDLVDRLINNADGTFLWSSLILADIEKSARLSTAALRRLLASVPTTLDETYEKILERSSNREDAQIILHIVMAAIRPLTLEEMNVAFNITDQHNEELELEPDIHATIRELCGLFVKVVNQKIYLIHQTAKDFLLRQSPGTQPSRREGLGPWKHSLHPTESHFVIAQRCIWYLSMNVFGDRLVHVDLESDLGQIRNAVKQCIQNHDFLEYAANHWVKHFQAANIAEGAGVVTLASYLCETQTERFKTWFFVHWQHGLYYKMPTIQTGFAAAAFLGLYPVVKQLIENGIDVNSTTEDDHRTALGWATANNQQAVITLLLENGADANSKDCIGRTPLWLAASRNSVSIVKQLLQRDDVDPNCIAGNTDPGQQSTTASRGTPLWAAARNGYGNVVKVLLTRSDVNPNLSADAGGAPLMRAVESGHEAVVRLLLSHGVEIRSAFVIAAQRSDSNTIQILLEHGVGDIDSSNARGVTPLMRAAWCGNEENVRLLLEAGADPNIPPDPNGEIIRAHGSDRDQFVNSMIRVTIEEGFFMVEGSGLGAAIHEAVIAGHVEVLRLLLDYGADLEMKDSRGLTSLRLAVTNGREAVARLLLEKGARDTGDMKGVTSLHTAALKGNEILVQLLLDSKAADMEARLRNEMAWTVLHCAAYAGHIGVVQILMKHSCDLDAQDGYGHTAQYWAKEKGHLAVVELLESRFP